MAQTTTVPAAELKGIGGWLILPMLTTLISPVLVLITIVGMVPVFKQNLAPGFLAFVIGELVFNFALIAGWIVSAVWLFKHKRSFPSLFIAMLVITFVGQLVDSVIAQSVYAIPFGPDDYRGLARSFIGFLIWAPYMVKSKRVQNTFTES